MLRKFIIFFITTGILIGGAYLVFFSSFFSITKISVEKSGNAVSAASLSPFLDKVKGKNLIFLRTGSLTRELEQTFKHTVLLVRIRKSYPNRLVVKVEEHPAVMNLRIVAGATTQKFVLNQIGYSIFENLEQKDIPILIVRQEKPVVGKGILIEPEKLMTMVLAFKKFQELMGMKIIEGEWKKIERELHLKTEKNFTVWLDLTSPVEKQLLKLKRALPKLDIYREPLEYIDLRIASGESEKVIFKRRGKP